MDEGDVVLVTGTTGGLGSFLLAQLASDPKVVRIYALNRKGGGNQTLLKARQRSALLANGLDANSILRSGKVILVEGDLTEENIGLSQGLYSDMQSTVTHIIHNAWPVHFNLSLGSFEPSVKGVRALVDFALRSPLDKPPKLIFTSSIGVFANVANECGHPLPETPINAEVTVGVGYSESKWVAEQILLAAAEQTSLRPLIVRLGQLYGGKAGVWNVKEWLPSMIRSSIVMKCLPTDDKDVCFISSDLAAAAFADFCKADVGTNIVHLVHPRPVPWSKLASVFAKELDVQLVTLDEWLGQLETLAQSTQLSHDKEEVEWRTKVPALEILGVFKSFVERSDKCMDALGLPRLSADQAMAASPTLSDPNLRQLDVESVMGWISYWRRTGFLSE
ncbi:hypothetical protein AX17_005548 [Amanita inopinata Kibby_2008]|nr:hypothetical protein AX17_005548 [Amanita inopinata Kibby_2008]